MRRVLQITRWTLREPTHWRVALMLLLVLVFSLLSRVTRPGGSPSLPPETTVQTVLVSTASLVVNTAYPFLFPLIAVLATLALVAQRESGAFAAFQALGFRRWEILLGQVVSILVLTFVPAILAFLVLPPLVEPRLAMAGSLGGLYPQAYWLAMPRLLLAVVFLTLFASSIALVLRRVGTAFAAMVTFFFIGWYIGGPLGPYGGLAPPLAFVAAYDFTILSLPGIPIDPALIFLIWLSSSIVAFVGAWVYASLRGELQ